MRVIDADAHVREPKQMWETYLEEPYRARAPRIIKDNQGFYRLLLEGKLHPRPEGKGCGVPYVKWAEPEREERLGAYNPEVRLRDMDTEGIAKALLLPTQGLAISSVEDPEFAAALCRAFNNWLAEFCRPYRDRLLGVAAVPLQDVPSAIQELDRAVTQLGYLAVYIRPNPIKGRNLDHPAYDPFYERAQALGVPVLVHEGTGHHVPTAGTDRFDVFFFTHMVSHPFEQMLASMCLICGGVLERFPALRVAFLEAGASWLPYWLWRMDEHYHNRPFEVPGLRMRPSEYFRRQCYVTCEPEETPLPETVQRLGADRILFSSDYPHWDSLFPKSVATVRERADLSEEAKARILGLNAAELLSLGSAAA